MLTPQEVSTHAFSKAVMGGYNMAMVDEFLDELTDDYTALYKENAALKSKMKVLVEKVEDYRATEDSMRATLLTAQKMAPASTRAPTAATARRRSRNIRTLPFLMAIPSFSEFVTAYAGPGRGMTALCGMTITRAVFFCRIVKFPVAKRRRRDVFIDGAEEATIGQYANYGPNNEVYLAQGQAISFKLTDNTNEIASIQIGAKAPNGAATMVVEDKVSTTTRLEQQLNTATEMYYNITEQAKDGQLVTISNTGNGILSLTNLKITYKTSGQTVTLSDLTAEEQANAVAMVQALFAAPVETVQPERFDASWGGSVRAGRKATLTVKASGDVDAITVDGVTVSSYTTRTERTGWGWWSPKVTYRVFTYTATAPAQTTDYAVCAVNAEGTASEPITATLTVRPATWWNWWF